MDVGLPSVFCEILRHSPAEFRINCPPVAQCNIMEYAHLMFMHILVSVDLYIIYFHRWRPYFFTVTTALVEIKSPPDPCTPSLFFGAPLTREHGVREGLHHTRDLAP